MREIKFRGKVKGTCKNPSGLWVYGFPYNEEDRWAILYDFPGGFGQGRQKVNPVIPETVGQLTGMKDKQGKDVYEDDIIGVWVKDVNKNDKLLRHRVSFNNGAFVLDISRNMDGKLFTDLKRYLADGYVVVGNIHDNPELLSGSEV